MPPRRDATVLGDFWSNLDAPEGEVKMNPSERRLQRNLDRERKVVQIVAVTAPTFAVYYEPEDNSLWSVEVLCWALCEESKTSHDIDEEVPSAQRFVTGLVDLDVPALEFADDVCESEWGEFLCYSKNKQEDPASLEELMKEEVDRRRKEFVKSQELQRDQK